MKRGYHHGDLRRALLDAAEAIVGEEGIAAVTMSAVARRSGVSSGAPYRHFRDREELLRALSERAQGVVARRLAEASAGAPDMLEGFRRSGVEYVRFAVDEPALFAVLSRGEFTDRHSEAATNPADHQFAEQLEQLLGAGDPTADLDPEHPVIQQLAARCLVHGLAHMFADGNLAMLGVGNEQAGRIAEALTQALGPPRISGSPPDPTTE